MDHRLRTLLLSFCFSVAALSAMVAQPRFFLEISQREVVANEPFQVRFTIEGASGGQFRPPDWNGLEVLQGPKTTTSTRPVASTAVPERSICRGRVSIMSTQV